MIDISKCNEPVAENIKRILKEKKIKQNVFAESLGYSASKFNSMLQGRKLINVSDIVLIMRLLNIESEELFKGVE